MLYRSIAGSLCDSEKRGRSRTDNGAVKSAIGGGVDTFVNTSGNLSIGLTGVESRDEGGVEMGKWPGYILRADVW